MVLMMLTCAELCTALSNDANVMLALLGTYAGVRCCVLQCNDIDVLLHDAMSSELTDSTRIVGVIGPRSLTDSSLDSWGYRPKKGKAPSNVTDAIQVARATSSRKERV